MLNVSREGFSLLNGWSRGGLPAFEGVRYSAQYGHPDQEVHDNGEEENEGRHVYNTKGATSGVGKWGAGSDIDGQRVLFCGAQAMGLADIGEADWNEKGFDYENQQGISIGKIFGYLKPVFYSNYNESDEDFGLIVCDTAL